MAKRLQFIAEFPADLQAALTKYQLISVTRAAQLRAAITKRLREIAASPNSFPSIEQNFRFARLQGFPYLLVFKSRAKSVHILRLTHVASDPALWLKPIDDLES